MPSKFYENYPCKSVLVANLVQLLIYIIGGVIINMLGLVWLLFFIVYIFILEIRLLKMSCVNCYYYGKFCVFGKGKLCSLFFKKGSPKKFISRKITWKDLLPELMVSLIPFVAGIVFLVMHFNWLLLILVIALFLLASAGNGFVRSKLACKYCKQRKLGCPAEKLFRKKAKK